MSELQLLVPKSGARPYVPTLVLKSFSAFFGIGLRTGATTWDECEVMRGMFLQAKSRSVIFSFRLCPSPTDKRIGLRRSNICPFADMFGTCLDPFRIGQTTEPNSESMKQEFDSATSGDMRGSPEGHAFLGVVASLSASI